MIADVVAHLRCPHCGAALHGTGAALHCDSGHSFDVARQGYVNLLPGDPRTGTADTADMVQARAAFLARGHYDAAADAVADAVATAAAGSPGCVVDVGAGTGYHLSRVLDRTPGRVGLALDLSKHAARRAARAHPRLGAVVCDAWRALPVRTGTAAAALCVFAPRDGAELRRVLRPGGVLVVVTPTDRHLAELVGPLGLLAVDARKPERLARQLGPHLRPEREATVEWRLLLSHDDVTAAAAMGPSAHHTDPVALAAAVRALPERYGVTASVTVSLHRHAG